MEDSITLGKSKKCHKCKKKNIEINELPPVIEEEFFIPSTEDIKNTYLSLNGDYDKEYVNKLFNFLFNEDYVHDCKSCSNQQNIKLGNFLRNHLKVNI